MTRLAMVIMLALPAAATAQATLSVRAENPLQIARPSETIAVPWASVRSGLIGVSANGVRVIDLGSGNEIVSQVVDNDGDGTMDELIFQVDLASGETRRFTIEAKAPQPYTGKARAYAVHVKIRATMSHGKAIASRFASMARGSGKSTR